MKVCSLLLPATLVLSLCGVARDASALAPSDPRIVINAVNTPGSTDATYLIMNPGSYYLDQDLIGEAGKVGIRVMATNVRIDLMGFTMRGSTTSLHAIIGSGAQSNVVLSNGSISDWPRQGIALGEWSNVRVRDLCLSGLGQGGIRLGEDSVVERCNLVGIGGFGIAGGSSLTVAHCKVSGIAEAGFAPGIGISAGHASIVRDCTVTGNGGTGISVSRKSMVLGCTVTENYAGISGEGALVADCTVSDNLTIGVNLIQATVRNCEIANNGSHGLLLSMNGSRALGNRIAGNGGDGIWAYGGARIEENDVRSHAQGVGIRAVGTGSFVVKNTLFANSVHLSVPSSGNFVGPLVFVNAVNGRSDPWANVHGN